MSPPSARRVATTRSMRRSARGAAIRAGALAAAVPRPARHALRLSARRRIVLDAPGRGCGRRAPDADQGLFRRPQGGAGAATRSARALQAAAAGRALSVARRLGAASRQAGRRDADAVRSSRAPATASDRRPRRPPGPPSRPSAPTMPTCSMPRSPMSAALQQGWKRVIVAAWSEGSRERLQPTCSADHGLKALRRGRQLAHRRRRCPATRSRSRSGASRAGFETPDSRSSASRTSSATGWCGAQEARRPQDFISELSPASRRATSWSMSTTASAASSG
jgi:hypothetical protein